MLGLLPLAGMLFLSGEFHANGSAVAELRVGQAPVQAGQDPQAGVVAALTPIAEGDYAAADRQVIVDYGPRILWRQPNGLGSKKPIVLHVLNVSVTFDLTPNVRLIERGSASYGAADYAALNQLFMAQSALPQVLDIFAVSAGTGLRWDASRLWRLETMFDVEHRDVVGSTTTPIPNSMGMTIDPSFRQTNLALDTSAIARLTRRNDLVLTLGVSDRILHNGVDIVGVTPQLGLRSRLTRGTELRTAAGVTYVRDRGSAHLVGTQGIVRPVGSAELDTLLYGQRNVAWRGTVGAAVDYFVDPFLRIAGPRLATVARSLLLLEPDWTIGLEASFSTSLRGTPPANNGARVDETTVSVALPVRHRISRSLVAEAGLRWSVRAPRIRADDVTFHERQNWIYVSLTGTTRRVDEWRAPREYGGDSRDEGVFARPPAADASRQSTVQEVPQTDLRGPAPLPDTSPPEPAVDAEIPVPSAPASGIQRPKTTP